MIKFIQRIICCYHKDDDKNIACPIICKTKMKEKYLGYFTDDSSDDGESNDYTDETRIFLEEHL